MELTLLTVGKTDVKWVKEGLDLYTARLSHYAPFRVEEIPQLKNAGSLTREQIKQKEGALILDRVAPGVRLILLDEHGREFRSLEFADYLGAALAGGGKGLCFVTRVAFPCRK